MRLLPRLTRRVHYLLTFRLAQNALGVDYRFARILT
jgi:hypothetical protein